MIIYLLSGPRNCSTTLISSFSQRSDTTAIDEPFYGMRLKDLDQKHPLHTDILQTMECNDADRIHDDIEIQEHLKGHVFVKNMANTAKYMKPHRLLNYHLMFLIRHPAETIMSYVKIHPNITADDLCLESQVALYNWWKETIKEDPIVIDASELTRNPSSILRKVCYQLHLPFTETMLSWPRGPKEADGIWASAWYENVHSSTSFVAQPLNKIDIAEIPTKLIPIYDTLLPYYQRLSSFRIQP